jgi:virginiamycin B lyase
MYAKLRRALLVGIFGFVFAGCSSGGSSSLSPTVSPQRRPHFTEPHFTEFSIPTARSNPIGITSGPDGALWFTEFFANKIGRYGK